MTDKRNDKADSSNKGRGFSRRKFLGTAISAIGVAATGPALGAAETVTGNVILAQAKPLAGKTIRYQQRNSPAEDFVRKIFAPRFQDETGCKVVIEDIPQVELFAKVQIMAVAGQIGDLVFGMDSPWLATWGAKGLLRPIDDYIQAEKFDLGQYYAGVKRAVTVGGKVYGLPTTGHPGNVNLFFNKTMFQKAGITPPDAKYPQDAWTWDTVLEAAKALTKETTGDGKTDVWGYLQRKFSGGATAGHLRQFGGDIITTDGKTATIGSEKAQASYRYLQDLTWKYKVVPTPADVPVSNTYSTEKIAGSNFATGQLAMFEDAAILITTMGSYVKDFEWGVFPAPPGPSGKRGSALTLNTTMITANSKQPEASWEFLKLISSREAGVQKLLTNSGSPGARPDVYTDAAVNKAFPWFLVGHKVMEDAQPVNQPANFRSSEIEQIIIQNEASIWLNDVPAEEGAKNMQKAIQQVLDEPA